MKPKKLNGNSYFPQEEFKERLKKNFPEVFSEGKIDFEKFKAALGENADLGERYGLSWKGKSQVFQTIQETTTKTLKPVPEESISFDTSENLFIEGDNLEALKILQRSYYGKVKMIYIDPPYNTGNDFVYNDKFSQSREEYEQEAGIRDEKGDIKETSVLRKNTKDSGHFHSNWLNMMYPRLYLARNLLREDGAIFVSIDDNEVHNLRIMMNEIFGEESFVCCFKWNRTSKAPTLSKTIRVKYEYVLFYSKSVIEALKGPSSYNTMAPLFNSGNPKSKVSLVPNSVEFSFEDCELEPGEYGTGDKSVTLHNKIIVKDHANVNAFEITARFKWSQATINSRTSEGQKLAFKSKQLTTMYYYLDNSGDKFIAPSDLINQEEVGVLRNDDGYNELRSLFGNTVVFDYPKPVSLAKYLGKILNDPSTIVLDFFAGSATTAHSIMKLNSEDEGNRKWIMIQLPEETEKESEARKAGYKTVADIGKERIRRAAKQIKEEKDTKLKLDNVQLDLGFKVQDRGYFVYCRVNKDNGFAKGKLDFDIKVQPYDGDDSWVTPKIKEAREILDGSVPEPAEDCQYCSYRKTAEVAAK